MDAAITLTGPAEAIARAIEDLRAHVTVETHLDAAIPVGALDGLNTEARAASTRESWGVVSRLGGISFFHDDHGDEHDASARAYAAAETIDGQVVKVTVQFRVIKVERV